MHSFADTAGRLWQVELTDAALLRIREDTGRDLRSMVNHLNPLAPVSTLAREGMELGATLCAILTPQLDKAGVPLEEFLDSLDSDVAYAAGIAFMRAYVGFFHPTQRDVFAKLIDKVEATKC
jgi:hypothetical protein